MKITSSKNDIFASSEIDYQPSLCFQAVEKHLGYFCEENDKDIYDEIKRKIAIFVDVVEITNIASPRKIVCFYKAFEGLIEGILLDMAVEYDVDAVDQPLDILAAELKKKVYQVREEKIKKRIKGSP